MTDEQGANEIKYVSVLIGKKYTSTLGCFEMFRVCDRKC